MEDNCFDERVESDKLSSAEVQSFNLIIHNLHKRRGIDFRQYRPRCLRRRIVVGMHDANVASLAEYVHFLEKNPDGYDKLLDRITINVSEFFRNPETFGAIEKKVIPALIERKNRICSNTIRIWSAGCATGEEPYSLAILFTDYLEKFKLHFTLHILATDIDKDALRQAEEGCYRAKSFRELKPYQVKRYLEKKPGDHYVIKPELKSMVKFTSHNMISDEPPAHFDLILCRNVVIYFSKELQTRVYGNFYAALAPYGFLVAGKTESLMGIDESLYEKIDLAERILRKKNPQMV